MENEINKFKQTFNEFYDSLLIQQKKTERKMRESEIIEKDNNILEKLELVEANLKRNEKILISNQNKYNRMINKFKNDAFVEKQKALYIFLDKKIQVYQLSSFRK